MMGIAGALERWLDRAAGIDRLKPSSRAQLVTEQIRSIIDMTPGMTAGTILLVGLVVFITYGTPTFLPATIWSAALIGMMLWGMRAWLAMRREVERRNATDRALRRAKINAFAIGLIWAALPIVLLPSDIEAARFTAGIIVAGALCGAGVALSLIPIVALSFSLPVLVGSAIAIVLHDNTVEAAVFLFLLVSYTALMPFVCLRLSRKFVLHIASELQVREQKDIIGLLLREFEQNSSDWLWEFDRDGRIDRVSERFAAAAGVEAGDLVGQSFVDFLRRMSSSGSAIADEIAQDVDARVTFQKIEIQLNRGDQEVWWRLTGKPTYDDLGAYLGYLGTASDITAEKAAERRINFLAHNDALTGLLNRGKFTEHLKACVARLERYGTPFTLLFLDLDQFKSVNDSRGHLIGDKLLIEVSRRIKATIRDTDIAARLGGDEFAIILGQTADAEGTAGLAERLVDTVGKPYTFDDEIVSIGVSIGIATAPLNGTRPDQILRNADLALYRAKAEGRGIYRFFESQMDRDVRERRMLELELREALVAGEFVLHYQPLVSAEDNRPTGFEALVRWNHPIRGVVPPAEFIPIAEQTGLIMQIGDWTIHEACVAAARWPSDLIVAVNLSARHFQMSDIAAVVRAALADSGLSPHRLELEITESLLIERPEDVISKLTELKAIGVTIAMDDFGTGYSSLSYLLKFPFDKIKIDKSFVTASSEDAVAKDILRSIASLGKTLKIRITAEGVETKEQVEFLRDIACHQLQGFYFAKPLDEPAMAAYFLRHILPELPADDDGSLAAA